ncbi:VanW family protein, partial [Megasphaera sp.]|uniref:VanW family protein n=1 Tax=Megasphaera sp. TaxID=2023260 RepID=UPI003F7D92BD
SYIDDELHLVGRRGLPWQRVADVVTTLTQGKDVPLAIAVDDEKLDKALADVHDKYDKDPQNAYAYVKDDQKTVAIEDAKDRIVINTDKLKNAVTAELHTGRTDTLDVPVDSREGADIKADDLKDIDTVLSYYTTHFDDTNPDRNVNIRLAQKRLNHAVVMAQKDFSFNKYVGTRTSDKGYKQAPSYFENKLEQSTGGGVCQVSTTLFNAALRAGLFIASREPHFAPAAYVPVGMDATVADDGLDFAFTNPFQHPVCVYTIAGQNTVTTYILGNHADTCSVSFETTHLQNLPHKVIKKHDDSVTEDKRKQEGYDGHDVTIRRTVAYSDGDRHVDTIESHYEPNDEIILTPGDDSEEVVSTADLEPQDPLLNAPHDMMDFNVPSPDAVDTADEE